MLSASNPQSWLMPSYSTPETLAAEAEYLIRNIRESQERLEEIQALLRLSKKYNIVRFPQSESPGDMDNDKAAELMASMVRMGLVSEQRLPLRVRILAAAERVLSDGKRRLSRELLPELERYGVVLDGQNPAGNLSAYLSKEKDFFQSSPADGGWTLTRFVRQRGFQHDPGESAPGADVAEAEIDGEPG